MRSMRQISWHLCVAVLLLLVLGSVQAFAQLDTGSIVGVVRDGTGAVISDASVKITNTKTGRVTDLKTGRSGEYVASGLISGPYDIEVAHAGFKTAVTRGLFLHATDRLANDVTLAVGANAEQVTVSAEAAVVDTQTSQTGATIASVSVTNLPLNGRDFTSLVSLVPGSVTTGGFGQTSIGGFETSMAGVNILLDGADATRIDVNATSTQMGRQDSRISRASLDSIQEFKVMQSTYSAEFGRSMGDVVNVITKSGGNKFHGTMFEFLRNDVFDAKNYFAREKTPLRLNQFGGNLSGPIVQNKLFFFVNYEGVRQIVNTPFNAVVLNQAGRAGASPAMQSVLAAIPLPNLTTPVMAHNPANPDPTSLEARTNVGWYYTRLRNSLREDTGSVKVDWNASAKDTFAFRYNIADSYTSTQYGVATGQVSPSYSRNHLFKASWNHIFSPNLISEAGFAFNRPQTDSLGGGGDFPIFDCNAFWGCTSWNNIGATPGPALFSLRSPQHSLQYLDTMTLVKGKQTFRFGLDIRHNVSNRAQDPQNILAFDGLGNFLAGQAVQLSTMGYTMVGLENTNYGFFLQDDIRLHPRFTLNLGVRYEYNSVLHGDKIQNFDIDTLTMGPLGAPLYEADKNNFAPRIGFAWDVTGKGKTVIRSGFGVFYNPLLTGSALSLASNYQQSFNYNIGDVLNYLFGVPGARVCGNPPYLLTYPVPNPLPACNYPLPANVNSIDRNMRDTYSEHWSFGMQQEIAKSTILEINYVGNHGVKLPAGAAYAGQELNYSPFGGTVISSDYGNIRRLGNFLGSNYNALQTSLRRRVANGLNIDANYTWSHELDNAVNIMTGAFQNSRNPNGDYSDGDIDVRHNLTVGAVYDIPKAEFLPKRLGEGWQISSMFQTRSGLPVNIALSRPFLGIDQLRPMAPAGAVNLQSHGPEGFFLSAGQFTAPANGTYGTLRRNAGRGPNFAQLDFAINKTTAIRENVSVQFRAEAFNLLNHPNFANPSGYLDDVNFGKSTSTIGNLVGVGTSRQLQFAVKLMF